MLRILTTTDLIASFFPQVASHGKVPGARAMQAMVDELRAEADAALWIDTGDFAQGSALGAMSAGTWPFLAMRELAIDVGVVGNHELDWGVEHLRTWAPELGFPLLAGNAQLGFAAGHTVVAGEARVGVVGLTYPHMAEIHTGFEIDQASVGIVQEHAARLRADGADLVVLALHDGVDLSPGPAGVAMATARMEALCRSLRGAVDLMLGGHTLGHHAGQLGGVPFLQPWPFSAQVGVADVHGDGTIDLATHDVGAALPWRGVGEAAQAALERQVVGVLEAPLHNAIDGDVALSLRIATGLLDTDARIELTVIAPWDLWNQAPRDGVFAHLPAGSVSLAQVLRLTPLSGGSTAWGGQLLLAEVATEDAERAVEEISSQPYYPGGPAAAGAAVVRRGPRRRTTRLCLTPFYAVRVDRALGRPHDWRPISTTWRAGLFGALSSS